MIANKAIYAWIVFGLGIFFGFTLNQEGLTASKANKAQHKASIPTPTISAQINKQTPTPNTQQHLVDKPVKGNISFKELVLTYGQINTIAGTGKFRKKKQNGWKNEFEGIDARKVELSRPHHAIGDKFGNIYIADKDAHAIRKISPQGLIFTVAGVNIAGDDGDQPGPGNKKHLAFPNGIWVSQSGIVYILDLGNSKIRKLDKRGILTTLLKDPEGIKFGRGLWVNEDEKQVYYCSGEKLKVWTPSQGLKTLASGFVMLGNLAVSPQGNLAVTDRGGHKVYKILANGNKIVVAGNGKTDPPKSGGLATATSLNEVRGIWFHPAGGYFLVTHAGNQIWYVTAQGLIHLFLDGDKKSRPQGDGQQFNTPGPKISEPRAISIDYQGNIIITENDYGYIRMIKSLTKSR